MKSGLTPRMLNHAAYVTHDVAATADFYTRILGMELGLVARRLERRAVVDPLLGERLLERRLLVGRVLERRLLVGRLLGRRRLRRRRIRHRSRGRPQDVRALPVRPPEMTGRTNRTRSIAF